MTAPWWKTSVVYQIYPRSFADANGDGVGDLDGIRSRLDHLQWLGVDAVWLSPIYRSPMADFGYDISDHCDIDPVFGDMDGFDRLLGAAHDRGLRLMLDWVPNHTSDQHPWFVESRSSRTSPKRDWYLWRDGRDGEPPNNWIAAFGGQAWTWDDATEQWYLHLFLPQQPDLNWGNPQVVDAMHQVLRFWLDRGVDGFRADVIHLIGKDPALPDQPAALAHLHLAGVYNHPVTHELLRGIRTVLDSYALGSNALGSHERERVMVGEINLNSPTLLVPYYGTNDELQLVFNFSLLWAPWDAGTWAELVVASETAFEPADAWPVWVLSNHDTPRHRTRYGDSEARARVAAAVLLTLRGTPFLYAGEELGLCDAVISGADRVDPGGRDGCRAPIPWDATPQHGWGDHPWLPWPPDPDTRNADALRSQPDSITALYRRLLAARRATPALHLGSWRLLDAPPGVLCYERVHRDGGEEQVRRVIANFGAQPVHHHFPGEWVVEVATALEAEGKRWDGALAGEAAVILRPAGESIGYTAPSDRQHP